MSTVTEDFEEGADGVEITYQTSVTDPTGANTTVPFEAGGDLRVQFTSTYAHGGVIGVRATPGRGPNPSTVYAPTRSFAKEFATESTETLGTTYTDVPSLWAGQFADSFPDYDSFHDLVISLYGTDEAFLAAYNDSLTATVTVYVAITAVEQWSLALNPVETNVGSMTFQPMDVRVRERSDLQTRGGDYHQIGFMAVQDDGSVDGTYTAHFVSLDYGTAGGEGEVDPATPVPVPVGEWMKVRYEVAGTTILGTITVGESTLISHTWETGMADPVITWTEHQVADGIGPTSSPDGGFLYAAAPGSWLLDDITWEFGAVIIPPPVLTPHPTRQYPRDDGNGLSGARRQFPPPKAGRVIGGYT